MSNFLFSKFTNYKYIHLDISLEPDIASYKDSIVAILPINNKYYTNPRIQLCHT